MKKTISSIQISLFFIIILVVIYLVDIILPVDLRHFGIRPRETSGLWGIVVAPLLHNNISHLLANISALFILLIIMINFSMRLTGIVLFNIWFVSGCIVWLLGRSHTIHIGASGLIFGLISFLIASGFFRKNWKTVLYSIAVFLLYGSALLSLLVYVPGISWLGHMGGFVAGILSAYWLRNAKLR
jgi:membrane associated rhomboid family serine protease